MADMPGAACLIKVVVSGAEPDRPQPVSEVDPMPAAAAIIGAAALAYQRQPTPQSEAVNFGHVDDVGRFSTAGERVTIWGTICCSADSELAETQRWLRQLAGEVAESHGCSATVDYLPPGRATSIRALAGQARYIPVET
jgi:amidohydrolase